MPCIWSSVFLTTTSYGLFVNSSKCVSDWHWYITDASISERMKHKEAFFWFRWKIFQIYEEVLTIAVPWYLHIISISPYLSLPNFMTSKLIQRTYFLADLKGIVGRCEARAAWLNTLPLAFHILDFYCFPMTTYRGIMRRTPIDVPLILMWFSLVDWGQPST